MTRMLAMVIAALGLAGCASIPAPDPTLSLQVFEAPDDIEWFLDGSRAYTSVVSRCTLVFDQEDMTALAPIDEPGDPVLFRCAFTPAGAEKYWRFVRRPRQELILCVNRRTQESSWLHACSGCGVLDGSLSKAAFEYVNAQLQSLHKNAKGIQPRDTRYRR